MGYDRYQKRRIDLEHSVYESVPSCQVAPGWHQIPDVMLLIRHDFFESMMGKRQRSINSWRNEMRFGYLENFNSEVQRTAFIYVWDIHVQVSLSRRAGVGG
jgi:hypothetical protein